MLVDIVDYVLLLRADFHCRTDGNLVCLLRLESAKVIEKGQKELSSSKWGPTISWLP